LRGTSVPIPELEPRWPDDLKIAVVTSNDARLGWRRLAHEVATAAQQTGHSFPLAERPPNRGDAGDDRTAFIGHGMGRAIHRQRLSRHSEIAEFTARGILRTFERLCAEAAKEDHR
jgi:hypothetical protein